MYRLPRTTAAGCLRACCAAALSPTLRLSQRAVDGARNKEENKERMRVYKRMCSMGCEIAAAPTSFLDEQHQERLKGFTSLSDPNDIHDKKEMEDFVSSQSAWITKLKDGCASRCESQCEASASTLPAHKCARACMSGCEAFISALEFHA